MALWVDILISAFLVIGGVFGIVGSFGLVKLQDQMQRLHAPTKATTLGVGGVLIASMLYFGLVQNSLSFHELLITLFLFLTAPITANFIAKAILAKSLKPEDLPDSGRPHGWSVYDDPPKTDAQDLDGGMPGIEDEGRGG
ncbi:MAG TPA: Na+/H+ antiporter subunit G [Maritimibacter sp.]|nr:Na+/H+ antiporter subunit G [Maritimibacter sp.]